MAFDRLVECRRAYDAVPSQDNEGWVPDRAGFKAGFYAACTVLQPRIAELEAALEKIIGRRKDSNYLPAVPATLKTAQSIAEAALDGAGRE